MQEIPTTTLVAELLERFLASNAAKSLSSGALGALVAHCQEEINIRAQQREKTAIACRILGIPE